MTVNTLSRVALNLAFALGLTASAAQAAPKEAGLWYDDSGKGAVMIEACGEKLCGRIYWLKEVLNAEGKPLRDKHNPNESQRNRSICGLQVIGGLARMQDGDWDSGWIYDPKEGKSYSVAMVMAGPDTLKVTGYLVMKMMGRTLTWTRAPSNLPSCKDATAAAQGGPVSASAKAPAAAPKPSKVAAPLPPDDDIDAVKPVTSSKAAARPSASPAKSAPSAGAAKSAAKPSSADTAKAAAAKSSTGGAVSAGKTLSKSAAVPASKSGSKTAATAKKATTKSANATEVLPWTTSKKKAPATGTKPAAEASKLGVKP